ncbi:calcium-binding protein [Yoonia sp. 208BN28-4]|uniref:calcium-binding protein n=1 Tax=Yoonia sp. 208BN28-4 TaxID=3126505 RepID=UPI0030B49B46
MEFVLPVLLLVGLGFLLFDDSSDTDDSDSNEGTAGDGGGGETPNEPVAELGEFFDLTEGPGAVVGTDGDDEIGGSFGDDILVAGDGDDTIWANGGNDTVAGEAGDDIINLGAGDDTSTNDQDFRNLAVKPSGSPAAGNDLIRGGDGNDRIIDILGANTLFGDDGDDILSTRDAEFDQGSGDTIFGGDGDDTIRANDGDELTGGDGIDLFDIEVSGSAGPAMITDFEDGETLLIRMPNEGPVDMARISTGLADNGEDTNVLLDDQIVAVLKGLTEVPDGAFDRMASGTAGAAGGTGGGTFSDPLFGTDEADTLTASDGQDAIFAGDGDDRISVAPAPDFTYSADDQDVRVQAGDGDDIIVSGGGDDVLLGSLGADIIFGNGGEDSLSGGFGRDLLVTVDLNDDSPDTSDGGRGNDVLAGDDGDVLTGGGERDGFSNTFVDVSSDPVIVTDFDPENEQLEIVIPPIQPPAADAPVLAPALPVISVTDGADGRGAEITYGETVVFVLQGVAAADVNVGDIRVTVNNTL